MTRCVEFSQCPIVRQDIGSIAFHNIYVCYTVVGHNIYIYICVYIYMYVCICIYMYTYTYVYMYVCVCFVSPIVQHTIHVCTIAVEHNIHIFVLLLSNTTCMVFFYRCSTRYVCATALRKKKSAIQHNNDIHHKRHYQWSKTHVHIIQPCCFKMGLVLLFSKRA
jgi:hypothetical protein